jgi:hypothetical protein
MHNRFEPCAADRASLAAVVALLALTAYGQVASAQQTAVDTFALTDARSVWDMAPPELVPSLRFDTGGPVNLQWHELGPVDREFLLLEDADNASPCKSIRVGIARDVAISGAEGLWLRIPGQGWLWTSAIRAEGAFALRLHFIFANMPNGAELWTYSPSFPYEPQGPFTGTGPWGDGRFYTPETCGDMVVVEYFVPIDRGTPPKVPFGIDEVQHIYRDIYGTYDVQTTGGDWCWLDSACYGEPWLTLRNAVVRITFTDGGTYMCSAQLITTVANDYTPYILTANHCISTDSVAHTMSALFFYQKVTCDGTQQTTKTASYANLVRTYSTADSTLLLLQGEVPVGAVWAGWTSSDPSTGTDVVCIQHPQGSWKRISFGRKTGNASGPTSHKVNWDTDGGVTDYGSSGSMLCREDTGQVVGNLCCGGSFCETPNYPDYYGKFSTAYSSGGFSSYLQAGSDDSYENNDTCAAARSMSEGTYNNLVVKSVDEDWYRINVSACATLSVDLTFTDSWGDIDMELYDGCGGTVVASSKTDTCNESLYYTNPGSARDYYLRIYLDSDTRNQYGMTFSVDPSGATMVYGTVDLEQYLGGGGIGAELQFREPGTSNVLYSAPITLSSSNGYALTGVPSCTYDVAVKFPNWLRQVVPNVAVTGSSVKVDFSCLNGDADGNNAVDVVDINTVLTHFGETGVGTTGDLDWDGSVCLLDVNLVFIDFGQAGDD